MKKIVINKCYGGFSLSDAAILRYAELKGITLYKNSTRFISFYTTVPPEEYEKLQKQDEQNKNYELSNAVYFGDGNISRDDEFLVKLVEELGEKANGECAELKIVEIPDGIDWEINEYDGIESIAEKHRTWY